MTACITSEENNLSGISNGMTFKGTGSGKGQTIISSPSAVLLEASMQVQ